MGNDRDDAPPPADTSIALVGGVICLLVVAVASGEASVARWGPDAYSTGAWAGGSLYAVAIALTRFTLLRLCAPRPAPPARIQVGSAEAMRPVVPSYSLPPRGLSGRLSYAFARAPARIAAAALLASPLSWGLTYLITAFHRPSDWVLFASALLPLALLAYVKLDGWAEEAKARPPAPAAAALRRLL